MRTVFSFVLALGLSTSLAAEEPESVDARFDKTGDKLVDAADWKKMSEDEKAAYARESVISLGEDPDALLDGGKTRAQQYLQGLRDVYGR